MKSNNVVRIAAPRAKRFAAGHAGPRGQNCVHEIYRLADVVVSPHSPVHQETARAHLQALLEELSGARSAG